MNSPPIRRRNADVRTREHLTPQEVSRLHKTAGAIGRYGARDALMIRVAYVHGLRASELVRLQWTDVDFESRTLHVRRLKGSLPAMHQLTTDEIRSLKRLPGPRIGYMFKSERNGPLTANGFGKIVARAGRLAGLGLPVHPHMLRHSCGYKLANEGKDTRSIQGYLGHSNIQNTVRYTVLAGDRFKNFWRD
jgi:type 1 fimbriae regulatory protein FimE